MRAIASARTMRLALSYARAFGSFIVQHPEEPSLAQGAATEGELATRLGLPGIPLAIANLKMIPVTCFPFGKDIVDARYLPPGARPLHSI